MISFGDREKAVDSTNTKSVAQSMFVTDSGTIQISVTLKGILTISGLGVKKVIVHSPHRTIPIIRRDG